MKKVSIVTTTINSPTEATLKFCEIVQRNKNFEFIIVGDTKTPHEEYISLAERFSRVIYLTPTMQDHYYPELSETIGWKTIQRRNIGFVYAYSKGCDVLATVDDDNIPYDNWGETIHVGEYVTCDLYESENGYFDPLSVTKDNYVWHRGYPIQHLQTRHRVTYLGKTIRKCLVQANLWDGDPDIDAMARLTHKPLVKYDIEKPYTSFQPCPFNSQNTFIAREAIPYYSVLPFVGRMDDIWGAYILQKVFPDDAIIFDKATVYQDRNLQDLVTNLENEVIGYRHTLDFINAELEDFERFLPSETIKFWNLYKKQFEVVNV
tara:strand:- start:35000 stop:35956 length:957 start_codon:yes stop_codon:yes gene_type:complete